MALFIWFNYFRSSLPLSSQLLIKEGLLFDARHYAQPLDYFQKDGLPEGVTAPCVGQLWSRYDSIPTRQCALLDYNSTGIVQCISALPRKWLMFFGDSNYRFLFEELLYVLWEHCQVVGDNTPPYTPAPGEGGGKYPYAWSDRDIIAKCPGMPDEIIVSLRFNSGLFNHDKVDRLKEWTRAYQHYSIPAAGLIYNSTFSPYIDQHFKKHPGNHALPLRPDVLVLGHNLWDLILDKGDSKSYPPNFARFFSYLSDVYPLDPLSQPASLTTSNYSPSSTRGRVIVVSQSPLDLSKLVQDKSRYFHFANPLLTKSNALWMGMGEKEGYETLDMGRLLTLTAPIANLTNEGYHMSKQAKRAFLKYFFNYACNK